MSQEINRPRKIALSHRPRRQPPSVDVKFYFYDKAKSEYREVADPVGLKSLVHSFNMDGVYRLVHSGGDLTVKREQITFGDDGIVHLELLAGDQAIFPCPADDQSVQCLKEFGFSYFIGSISYRLSLSQSGQL